MSGVAEWRSAPLCVLLSTAVCLVAVMTTPASVGGPAAAFGAATVVVLAALHHMRAPATPQTSTVTTSRVLPEQRRRGAFRRLTQPDTPGRPLARAPGREHRPT